MTDPKRDGPRPLSCTQHRILEWMREHHARYDLMHVLYAMGDLEGAARHTAAAIEPADRSGMRISQARAMEAYENVSSAKGDWESARAFSEQGLALLPGEPVLLGCRALLEYQVGDFDAGQEYLNRLIRALGYDRPEASTSYPSAFSSVYPG